MRKVSVLIVEDEFTIAEELKLRLLEFGFEVIEPVDNGQEAINIFKKEFPDLILMDIDLAGEIDGIETAQKINKLQPTPIIYVTGKEDDFTFKRAVETARPEAFIYKPIHPKMLYRQIDLAIQRFMEEDKYLKDSFFVKDDDYQYLRVKIEELVYIKAARSCCDIFTEKRKFTISQNLNTFLDKYHHQKLVRIHRSHAINIEKVEGLMGNRLIVNGEYLDLGKSYRDEIKKRLNII